MPDKKESAPGLVSGRASVREHDRSISQEKWERGCRVIPFAFALLLVLYAAWLVFAPCPS